MSCDLQNPQDESACTARPTFSIRTVMLLTAIWAALICVQSWQSMIVISVLMLTWLFGCNRTRQAIYWVTTALFVPSLLALMIGMIVPIGLPGKFVAVTPGVLIEQFLIHSDYISTAMFGAAAITTVVLLLAISAIRFFPKARNAVVIAAVFLGVFSAAFVSNQLSTGRRFLRTRPSGLLTSTQVQRPQRNDDEATIRTREAKIAA